MAPAILPTLDFQSALVRCCHERPRASAKGRPRLVARGREHQRFLIAAQTGAKIAVEMLDGIENKLIEVLQTLNEDFGDAP
jgi:hypothetical protein